MFYQHKENSPLVLILVIDPLLLSLQMTGNIQTIALHLSAKQLGVVPLSCQSHYLDKYIIKVIESIIVL